MCSVSVEANYEGVLELRQLGMISTQSFTPAPCSQCLFPCPFFHFYPSFFDKAAKVTIIKVYGGIEQGRFFEKGMMTKKNIVKRMIQIVANISSKVVFFFSIVTCAHVNMYENICMLMRNTHSQKEVNTKEGKIRGRLYGQLFMYLLCIYCIIINKN